MKLLIYFYKCGNCENTFKVLELPGIPYGEFLMRDDSGDAVYLNAINSKEFHELGGMLDIHLKLKKFDQAKRAEIVQKIFGIACDLSPEDSAYQIGKPPICPDCKSNNMLSWRPSHPPEFVEVDVKSVTHQRWNKLSQEEKRKEIESTVELILKSRQRIVELEKMGIEAMNAGAYNLAIDCFQKIVSIQPNYEHGMCYYDLACSYESIGNLNLARENFGKALLFMPEDEIYLGGLASFLFLHGSPNEAFDAHLKFLKAQKNPEKISNTLAALYSIGEKLGWTKKDVNKEIENLE